VKTPFWTWARLLVAAEASGARIRQKDGLWFVKANGIEFVRWGDGALTRADLPLGMCGRVTIKDAAKALGLNQKGNP